MMTIREMTDRVRHARQPAWAKSDPTQSIVWTQRLDPEDQDAVRRIVSAAGYDGEQRDEMIRQVSAMLVGQVTALDDHQPADGAD